MKAGKIWIYPLAIVVVANFTGCASVPKASTELQEKGRSFSPDPGKAVVYVYRPYNYFGSASVCDVSLDQRDFGRLGLNTYLFGDVDPGPHAIRSRSEMGGGPGVPQKFDAEAGKIYFFRVDPGLTQFGIKHVNEKEGRDCVSQCELSGDNVFKYEAEQPVVVERRNNSPMSGKKKQILQMDEHLSPLPTLASERTAQEEEIIAFAAFQEKAKAWRELSAKPPLPEGVQRYRSLAEEAYQHQDYQAAVAYYEKGLAVEPMWAQGHFNVASLFGDYLQNYNKAVSHMRRYLELRPDASNAAAGRQQMAIWQEKAKSGVPSGSPTGSPAEPSNVGGLNLR